MKLRVYYIVYIRPIKFIRPKNQAASSNSANDFDNFESWLDSDDTPNFQTNQSSGTKT